MQGQCQDIELVQSLGTPKMRAQARPKTNRTLACDLRVRTEVMDFSHVVLQSRARAFLIVENQGQSRCAIEHAYFSVNGRGAFALDFDPQTRRAIEPKSFAQIEVYFLPATIGAHEAKIIVWGEGRVVGSTRLRGMGVESGSTLEISPSSVDFGVRGMNCRVPGLREVYFHNPTNRVLNARYKMQSPGFFISGSSQTIEIEPASTATISLGFSPRVPDHHLGQLQVEVAGTAVNPVYLFGEGGPNSQNVENFDGAPELTLRGRPVPDSLRIYVDRVLVPGRTPTRQNWSLNLDSRQIRFIAPAPEPEQTVRIHYVQHCVPDTCGDGTTDPGEFCDDGNVNNHDACLSSCEAATCGDGSIQFGLEECDDGNTSSGDGCSMACEREFCGNGVIEAPEQCDQGAMNSNTRPDACRTNCRFAACQDAVLDDGEYCDDGNSDTHDSCVHCRWATCGDGAVHFGVEECDDGNRLNLDQCRNDCAYQTYTVSVLGTGAPLPMVDSSIVTSSVVRLPFPFRFLGATVTDLDIAQPGLVAFGPTQGLGPDNRNIPSAAAPNRFIALWWDALETTDPTGSRNAKVRQTLMGQAPNRKFVLQFEDLGFDGTHLTMELRVIEATGGLSVYYAPLRSLPQDQSPASASVGWESADGIRGYDALGCSPSCTLGDWPGGQVIHYSL